MAWILRILLGGAVSALGYFAIWKAEDVVGWIGGESYWAEQNFGVWGGTKGLIKIVGIVIMFVGFGIMVQLHTEILSFITGLVIPATRK
ncbi:hypothetical protein COV06_04245 [Candidatus Uhrbacteria bacterium CG10_big_fil_rev_8_21_14_0_10_50_16]|uniref:Uncharacterized protein n=1 Tax=Candidatus Uhrbacteria bacterium CG10_big_fil_rev_8_21_14_0_10_50_16 TaxID=1975039 RepID=A0A2H0RND1_9BACT|nr:MAG: hypothetical protein COV06_04245 [Candidatus Uhrbacteria bacterium CG10_big_fil_rev_8_21_14_0_10_50_16]